MDLSKYNQLEQLSKDQLDELENTLLDVIQIILLLRIFTL